MRNIVLGLVSVVVCAACAAQGALIFEDNYDSEDTGSGVGYPDGYSFFGTGIDDRGVTALESVSPDNSGYLALDNGVTAWGAGCWKAAAGGAVDLTEGSLSIYMKRTAGTAGGVAFKVWDGDGNEYRTADEDLFSISTDWTEFSQPLSALTHQDAGSGALDAANITQYGLIFYKAGSGTDAITYYFDDYTGSTIPEPGVAMLLIGGIGTCLFLRRRKRA